MGSLRNFPGRHDRKLEFHSHAEPLVAPEVKAMSRNIACPARDRLERRLEPDFDLKGQFVPTSCPTFFQFTWPNGFTNSHQPLPLRLQRLFEALAAETTPIAFQLDPAFAEEMSRVPEVVEAARQIGATWEYRTPEHAQRIDMAKYWVADLCRLRIEFWLIKHTLQKSSSRHD